jgi:hypothetical protein
MAIEVSCGEAAHDSPRDAVTISRTLVDRYTLIDITTSLPRSQHEPVYLRPAPPYVRAHVNLMAWCIQLPGHAGLPAGKVRINCFWSWNPKGWFGSVSSHLPSLLVGLVDHVRDGSEKVPVLLGYADVSIGDVKYDPARATLAVNYGIHGKAAQVEFGLSATEGWDVRFETPALWTSFVGTGHSRLVLRFSHPPLAEELVRVKVVIERTFSGIRINGVPVTVEPMEEPKRPLLEETASVISLRTMSTVSTEKASRAPAVERSIAQLVKRNYICKSCFVRANETLRRSCRNPSQSGDPCQSPAVSLCISSIPLTRIWLSFVQKPSSSASACGIYLPRSPVPRCGTRRTRIVCCSRTSMS